MLERCLRNDEASHCVAKMLQILYDLQGIVSLRRTHREKNILVYLAKCCDLGTARRFFLDEPERVGVDGFGSQVYILNAILAGEHFCELLLFARAQRPEPLLLLLFVELRSHSLHSTVWKMMAA